jgi:hypothetical protein
MRDTPPTTWCIMNSSPMTGSEQRTEYAFATQVKIRLPDPQNRDDQGGSLRSPENFDGVPI